MHTAIVIAIADLRVRGIQDIVNSGIRQIPDRNAAGGDRDLAGERLAASYVNFYFSNEAVILPAFGGENEESDRRAAALLAQWNPGRKIISVQARAILVGGGNIHCITQQIPAAKK